MSSIKILLLAGATSLLTATLPASADDQARFRLAQAAEPKAAAAAEATDPVALAEKDVEAAREALRKAMATGKGVGNARQTLTKALKDLKAAEIAAGEPVSPEAENADATGEPAPPAPTAETAEPASDEAPAEAVEMPEEADPAAAAEEVPEAAPAEPQADAKAPAPESAPAEAVETPAEPAPAEAAAPAEPPAADAGEPAAVAEPAPAASDATAPAEPATKQGAAKPPRKPPQTAKTPTEAPTEEAGKKPPPLPASAAAIKEGEAVEAQDGRIIVKEGGKVVIKHDDDERFRNDGGQVQVEKGNGGQTVSTVRRPDGSVITTIRNPGGDIVKRTRRGKDGREVVLIDDTRKRPPPGRIGDLSRVLPPIVVKIPRQQYIVESRLASPQIIEQALLAPPVEMVERPYSLEEVRQNARLRDKVRRIDIDTVTFDFGQATVPDDQVGQLDGIGRALAAVIANDPGQVFLIEGHTDAVGSDLANLALSDLRAESVAEILTTYFQIPPENLITQGYGEAYLKIPTLSPERENRRVTVRNISPLLSAGAQ